MLTIFVGDKAKFDQVPEHFAEKGSIEFAGAIVLDRSVKFSEYWLEFANTLYELFIAAQGQPIRYVLDDELDLSVIETYFSALLEGAFVVLPANYEQLEKSLMAVDAKKYKLAAGAVVESVVPKATLDAIEALRDDNLQQGLQALEQQSHELSQIVRDQQLHPLKFYLCYGVVRLFSELGTWQEQVYFSSLRALWQDAIDWEGLLANAPSPLDTLALLTHVQVLEFQKKTEFKASAAKRAVAYKRAIEKLRPQVRFNQLPEQSMAPAKKRVVIFTAQLLGYKHAPTSWVISLHEMLSTDPDIEVYMVETGDLTVQTQSFPWALLNRFNKIDWSAPANQGHYDFPIYQPDATTTLEKYQQAIDYVTELNPCFCIAVGVSVVADLLAERMPSLYCSLTSKRFDSLAKYFMLDPKIDQATLGLVEEALGHEFVRVKGEMMADRLEFERRHRDKMSVEEHSPIKRKDTDNVIAIVGNRLGMELDDDFLKLLNKLAERDYWFAFMGQGNIQQKIASQYPTLSTRSRYLGYQQDLESALRDCYLFLNPVRQGGGTGGKISLLVETPVLTTPFGDVGGLSPKAFHVENYQAMYQRVIALEDNNAYREMVRQCVAFKESVSGDEVTIKSQLLELIGAHYATSNHEQTDTSRS